MAGQFRTLVQSPIAQRTATPGTWLSDVSGTQLTTDAAIVARMNNLPITGQMAYAAQFPLIDPVQPGGSADIRFNLDTSAITLNGDVVGTFPIGGLPSGFRILTAALRFQSVGDGSLLDTASAIRNGFVIATVSPDLGTNWNVALDVSGGFLAVLLDTYGFQITSIGGTTGYNWSGNRVTGTFNTFINGTYDLLAFTYSFPQSGDSVSPGDIITITSDPLDPMAMDLNHVTLSIPCGVILPITQTTNQISFAVPDACDGALTEILTATGDGTQFSGPVTLGTLTILLVNGSGIYTLVTGQRHDEYYSNLRDGTTVSIKIPNPTAKTGFIGG